MNREQRRKQARELKIRNKQIRKENKMFQELFENLKQYFFAKI